MTESALKDRLQPALLDRLTDEERSSLSIRVTLMNAALAKLQLPAAALIEILQSRGLKLVRETPVADGLSLQLTGPAGGYGLSRLRELVLKPPGAPEGVTLHSFAEVDAEVVPNTGQESAERRTISMRRLRESVYRDLSWLLNSMSLDATLDLSHFPHVQSSVLNYGMPSFAGRSSASIDPVEAARRIEKTIGLFEPRLSGVRVVPHQPEGTADGGTLTFLIEAELWGQPASQHLHLRTSIDVATGDVALADVVGG